MEYVNRVTSVKNCGRERVFCKIYRKGGHERQERAQSTGG